MRFILALLLIIAASTRVVLVNGVDSRPAAEDATEVCTAADYAAGTCTKPNPDVNDDEEEWSSDDDGDEWDDEGEAYEYGSECVDRDENCKSYAEEGGCQENPGYMTYSCPLTCNTCSVILEAAKAAEFADKETFTKPCMDDDYRCKEWAEMVSRLDGEWSYPYTCVKILRSIYYVSSS